MVMVVVITFRVLEKVSGSEVKQKRGVLCMKYVLLAFVPDCVSSLDSFHSLVS